MPACLHFCLRFTKFLMIIDNCLPYLLGGCYLCRSFSAPAWIILGLVSGFGFSARPFLPAGTSSTVLDTGIDAFLGLLEVRSRSPTTCTWEVDGGMRSAPGSGLLQITDTTRSTCSDFCSCRYLRFYSAWRWRWSLGAIGVSTCTADYLPFLPAWVPPARCSGYHLPAGTTCHLQMPTGLPAWVQVCVTCRFLLCNTVLPGNFCLPGSCHAADSLPGFRFLGAACCQPAAPACHFVSGSCVSTRYRAD